jgi:hypothetical protein
MSVDFFQILFIGLHENPGCQIKHSASDIFYNELLELLPDVKIPHGVLGLVLGRRALSHFLSEILDLCIPAKLPQPSVSVM